MSYLTVVVAACIDRWALCSNNSSLRAFSRPNIAIRVILILLLVWILMPIHMAVFFNNNTGRCTATSGTYAFFYAIYSLIVIGILPLFLMILFSLLAWHNLRKIRSRVIPSGSTTRNITIHKRDRNLMLMLTGEVIVFCITTIPYPINMIYSVWTSSMQIHKNQTRLAIESLVGYIISPILNLMYCCVQFYGKEKFFLRWNRCFPFFQYMLSAVENFEKNFFIYSVDHREIIEAVFNSHDIQPLQYKIRLVSSLYICSIKILFFTSFNLP